MNRLGYEPDQTAEACPYSEEQLDAGVRALIASGLVDWNPPRLAMRRAVEEILRQAQSHGSQAKHRP